MKWSSLLVIGVIGVVLCFAVVFSRNTVLNRVLTVSGYTLQDLIDGKLTVAVFSLAVAQPASSFPDQADPGLPVRFSIPKINVDSSIEYVGLTPDGTMDITKRPDDVAWFQLGPRPGAKGSAVIAGHYGHWKDGSGSIFDNLNTVRAGDKIYVTDDQGVTTTFVVRESRLFDPKADASVVFDSHDGVAHLNLITCDGVWDANSKSYSKRLVVFTDKE